MGGMSSLVKDVARLFAGFILTFGLHMTFYGHAKPGGGFAGGVIVAGGFILLVLAYGRTDGSFGLDRSASFWQPLGLLLLLMTGLLGLAAWGVPFRNLPLPCGGDESSLFSGGTALVADLALCLNVWMGLVAVFLGLAMFRRAPRGEE
jgi:multicomponent Na+:H+ antiporter subunit B